MHINTCLCLNITLKYYEVLPLPRIYDAALGVCKQVIETPLHMCGAH